MEWSESSANSISVSICLSVCPSVRLCLTVDCLSTHSLSAFFFLPFYRAPFLPYPHSNAVDQRNSAKAEFFLAETAIDGFHSHSSKVHGLSVSCPPHPFIYSRAPSLSWRPPFSLRVPPAEETEERELVRMGDGSSAPHGSCKEAV